MVNTIIIIFFLLLYIVYLYQTAKKKEEKTEEKNFVYMLDRKTLNGIDKKIEERRNLLIQIEDIDADISWTLEQFGRAEEIDLNKYRDSIK